MTPLIFAFQDDEVAQQFDLTRLGAVTGESDDGLTICVEVEDEWATATNLNLVLMAFGLYNRVLVTEEVPITGQSSAVSAAVRRLPRGRLRRRRDSP